MAYEMSSYTMWRYLSSVSNARSRKRKKAQSKINCIVSIQSTNLPHLVTFKKLLQKNRSIAS
jgi:hypothetical protein